MERIELNVKTGKRTVIPLTQQEIDDATVRSAEEKIKQDAERLEQMKRKAEDAELRATVNADTGTTPEAVAYQAEKRRVN